METPFGVRRSKLEVEFDQALRDVNIDGKYETVTLPYTVPEQVRTYCPDFPVSDILVYETKGRLTSDDRKKMLLVKAQYPDKEFILVFSQPLNTINKGSKTTYADWCEKNGFRWLEMKKIKENPKLLSSITRSSGDGKSNASPKKKKK